LDALLLDGDTASVDDSVTGGESLNIDDFDLDSTADSSELVPGDLGEELLTLDGELDLPNLDLDETAALEADDLGLDLELDLDLTDEKSSAAVDEFELDLDLDLLDDADLGSDATSDLVSNGDVSLDSSLDDLDLSLDINEELNAAGPDESFDMSYQDDLANTPDAELDLADDSVDELSEDVAEVAAGAASLEAIEEHQSAPLGDDQQDSIPEADITLDEDLSLEGDIDSDFGDLDLAALDQEMDDLDLEAPANVSVQAVAEADTAELGGDSLLSVVEDEHAEEVADAGVADAGVVDSDLSEFTAESLDAAASASDDMDDELDFLADSDEVATKLDLARAYIDMGDSEGAKDILGEVQLEGDDTQKSEAKELLGRID
jgi:pilus assembly protein FimV